MLTRNREYMGGLRGKSPSQTPSQTLPQTSTPTPLHTSTLSTLSQGLANTPTVADRRLRDRLARINLYSAPELDAILQHSQTLRAKLKERPLPFSYTPHTVVLSLYGFCPIVQRNGLLWTLKSTLSPKLLYASNTKPSQWEAILVMTVRESTFQNHYHDVTETPLLANGKPGSPQPVARVDAFISELQTLADLFHASATFLDLDNFQNPSTITCLHRIEQGTFVFGNLWVASNRWLLCSYQANLRRMQEAALNQNVRAVTGMDFTSGNFLSTYHNYMNAQLELTQLRTAHVAIMNHLHQFEGMVRTQAEIWSEVVPNMDIRLARASQEQHTVNPDNLPTANPENRPTQPENRPTVNPTHSPDQENTRPNLPPPRISAPLRSPLPNQISQASLATANVLANSQANPQPTPRANSQANSQASPQPTPRANSQANSQANSSVNTTNPPVNTNFAPISWPVSSTYRFIHNNTSMLHELNHIRHFMRADATARRNLAPEFIDLVTPGASPSPTPHYEQTLNRTPNQTPNQAETFNQTPNQVETFNQTPATNPSILIVRRIMRRTHSVPPIDVNHAH